MINEILQFIKKTILSIKLARYDALFLVEGLKTFKKNIAIARPFIIKNDLPKSTRIRRFLEAEDNLYLYAAADEISARNDIIGDLLFYNNHLKPHSLRGNFLFRSTGNAKEGSFYLDLFQEIVNQDFPQLSEQYKFFKKRLDVLLDMRFYASELEIVNEKTADIARGCAFDIDWIRTDKNNLYLCFDEDCFFTDHLEIPAQESLSRLFAYMLFEESIFISSWQGVSASTKGKVSFLDFDYVYPADESLKIFAQKILVGSVKPQNAIEFKLQRALRLLDHYCPDIRTFKLWEHYLNVVPNSDQKFSHSETLLRQLQKNGVVLHNPTKIDLPAAQDMAYLLDAHRHKNDPRFNKSRFVYWGPLLVLIYVLFRYF